MLVKGVPTVKVFWVSLSDEGITCVCLMFCDVLLSHWSPHNIHQMDVCKTISYKYHISKIRPSSLDMFHRYSGECMQMDVTKSRITAVLRNSHANFAWDKNRPGRISLTIFFRPNTNSMEIHFWCKCISEHVSAINCCTCHISTAVVSSAEDFVAL